MVKRTIVALLAIGLICPLPQGFAQRIPEPILRLRSGSTVRIATASRGALDGQFLRATGDTLVLVAQGTEIVVPVHDVQLLWQRGRATKSGALAGGLVGAAGAGVFFGVLCGGVDGTCNNRGAAVAFGAAIGAAGGALLGAVVGSAIPKWHRRYP